MEDKDNDFMVFLRVQVNHEDIKKAIEFFNRHLDYMIESVDRIRILRILKVYEGTNSWNK